MRVRLIHVWSVLLLVICLLSPQSTGAQTVVTNPTTLEFNASADHAATLPDGKPAVDHYTFDVYSVGASQPFQSTNIGKPAPGTNGVISYNFASSVAGWPLPGGNYVARVKAVGPNGASASDPSNQFTFSSCSYTIAPTSASLPASGGGTQFTVTAGSACQWTVTSAVSWITRSPTGGTGNGTVVLTVAANGGAASRTGTVTAGGRTFTVSQAGTAPAAPSTPTSPTPAAGATGVSVTPTLVWSSTGASTYAVRFGTTTPPPQVTTGLAAPSYVPGTLGPQTTYYWQIVATNSVGSTTGPIWSFTTAASGGTSALPTPWVSGDVGSVGLAGSASFASGAFQVAGAGADIGGTADAFQFVRQPLTGRSRIQGRVVREQVSNASAEAGLMMREGRQGVVANAPHVSLLVLPNGTVQLTRRATAGGATAVVATASQPFPAWLRLVRSGSTVTGAVSVDGTSWRTVGSTTLSFSSKSLVGLAVSSHSTTARNTATIDSVAVR
jgi:hypothetical protein